MKIQARDLRDKQRDNLWDVVPLSTPYLMYIEPTNLCNARCAFCPTSDKELLRKVGRPNGHMSLGLFTKLVDQMGAFDKKIRRVHLYKDGEPLLNEYFVAMVKYLKLSGVAEQIWTKTNGLLLTPEYNERLVNSGLDMIGISIKELSTAGYKKIAGVDVDFSGLCWNLHNLYKQSHGKCKIYISIADTGFTDKQKEWYYKSFGDICDHIAIEGLHGWSMSSVKDFTLGMAGDTFDGTPLKEKIACPWTLYSLTVNHDGSVAPCNEDWAYKCIVGNIKIDSIKDIWNGELLYQFRKMHLEGRRHENVACRDCYYLKVLPDNVDEHRLEILEKLSV